MARSSLHDCVVAHANPCTYSPPIRPALLTGQTRTDIVSIIPSGLTNRGRGDSRVVRFTKGVRRAVGLDRCAYPLWACVLTQLLRQGASDSISDIVEQCNRR